MCVGVLLLTCACGGVVTGGAEPGADGGGGQTASTTTNTASTSTSTSSLCDYGDAPDPDCGCVGYDWEYDCRCDCGGIISEVHFLDMGCTDLPVSEACPDGWGGAGGFGGAPSSLSCTQIGPGSKICGP